MTVSRLVPDAQVPPESYCWFSFASAFQLFLAVESSLLFHKSQTGSLYSFDFYVSEMMH